MAPDRQQRLEQIFTEAIEQPARARADFVTRACGADAGLCHDVKSLLCALERSGEFLATPALELLAQQIAHESWSIQPGDRIGSYTLERRLGAGGMGEVWRARDERLGRAVAIKRLLPHPSNAAVRVRAFQQEARAAGTLNHTNVLTVYDVGEHGDAPYLVTECLEGESLRARLRAGALPLDTALDIALQVSRGLGAAHAHGIVHRDLKPENIFLATDGRVKILDFGLATLHDPESHASGDASSLTMPTLVAGTAPYMAPEQVRGEPVDRRADIFALGAVLYEMLTGRGPFNAGSTLESLEAVLTVTPPDLAKANPAVPPVVSRVVHRCLAKAPDDRFATVGDVTSALESVVRARNLPASPGPLAFIRRPAVMAAVAVVLIVLGAAGWRWRASASRGHWARSLAPAEIQRLSNLGDYVPAFLLARDALAIAPDDPHLKQLWLDVSVPGVVTTEPPGAEVEFSAYRSETPAWFPLGRTPLNGVRIPRGLTRVRISKAGFQTIEGSASPPGLRYRLDAVGTVPAEMVHVSGGRDPIRFGLVGAIDDYWIDRFEITNRQFKEFVDQGGYQKREYWREPFVEGDRSLTWDEAIGRFHDASGRPGPATWNSGTYPEGQADFPVGGVSWYEAAAYAVFARKSLPTMYHWYRAAGLGRFADILTVSNFGGKGPAAVGRHHGLGPYGTYDMAGNVKEWCWNETAGGRFLLGGAWYEPRYMFADYDARSPFERAPGYGFRLAKYLRPLAAAVTAPVRIEALGRDARQQKPVSNEIFEIYRRQYAYDRGPLNAVVESTEQAANWLKYTIAIDAAYGGERLRVHLFLPRDGTPPYQTVVFFPATDAFRLRASRDMSLAWGDFIIGSGRAFLYPVYKGTYERRTPEAAGTNAERELRIAWARDLGRAIDYLETRPDIDRERLAFYGVSIGGDAGVIMTAIEPRFRASVLQGAGIWAAWAPEIDLLHYAPRVRVPTLMVNGRYDFENPYETAQRSLFARLGPPAEHKRHAVFETGHAQPTEDVASEILPWLDRYLGQVPR
jgi:serine/threonine protein kinase